jgi:modification target Cys-rich repeat protein
LKERKNMRKLFVGLNALIVPAIVAGLAVAGCDDKNPVANAAGDVCGPCGTVAQGDIGISGNAKLDGFFKAVADLNKANVAINADFVANVADLEAAFGIQATANATIDARVAAVVAAIKAEVSANVDGGLKINYVPAQCSANLSVGVEAQATCEVKGGCDAKVDPGHVSVKCEGSCTGGCTGGCEGSATCKVTAPSVACSGTCEGKCEVDVAAECSGTCKGTCSGTCSVKDASGNCNGTCSGTCTGKCEAEVKGSCTGTCSGSCTATAPEASCQGEVECSGKCTGSCSGGCQGEATPPSASASCSASADCQAQAKAQASANLECTPPSISVGYELKAGVNAQASAKFKAELEVLKVKGAAILTGFAKYSALIDGKIDGQVVFATSPLASVQNGLEGVISGGLDGSLFANIPAGRISCVIPAMSASVTALADMATNAAGTLKAQGDFAAAFKGGFKG